MNLHVTGAGPTTPAEATWLRTLFAHARTTDGTPEERLASINERNAWAAVQREKADAANACHLGAKARAR